MTVDRKKIEATMISLLQERGRDKTLCPSEVARAIAGNNEKEWRLLMKPVKAVAISLAEEGTLIIKRKGKPVEPENLKGIYRLSLAEKARA